MRTNLSKTISLFFDSQIGINAFSLYFASFVTTTACQTATSPDATVMNNGKVVENPYEDPTVVRMLIDGKFACTATLIEESGRNLVLTAAHCVFKRPTDRNLYNPNQIQFDIKGSLYTAKSMIPYPQYKGDIKNDLALVFLDPSVRFPSVRKVGSSPREGDLVTIDGYGVFSLSYVLDDDDGDGMPNGRDYCPNTDYWKSAQIDGKGCAFDQWPSDFPATSPTGAHASGIRRRGTNYVSKIADGAIFLKETRYNGRTQEASTQVASGDSGGPLLDNSGRIIGVTSVAQWDRRYQSVDNRRTSGFSNITSGCNLAFIRTGKTGKCEN